MTGRNENKKNWKKLWEGLILIGEVDFEELNKEMEFIGQDEFDAFIYEAYDSEQLKKLQSFLTDLVK
ncbi:MAG: hypothetical protein ACTSWX_06515 [Promethearchaeota archaeon]